MRKDNIRNNNKYNWVIKVTLLTFLLSIIINVTSQVLLDNLSSLIFAFIILLVVMLIGVIFDAIGIAATSAQEKPFHAKASRKIFGAKNAIKLVRNADQVSNFTSDVIGDISGILSGTIGAFLVLRIREEFVDIPILYLSIIFTSIIAALTVGGKAIGKFIAIKHSTDIMLSVAKVNTKISIYLRKFVSFLSRNRK